MFVVRSIPFKPEVANAIAGVFEAQRTRQTDVGIERHYRTVAIGNTRRPTPEHGQSTQHEQNQQKAQRHMYYTSLPQFSLQTELAIDRNIEG